ncbi:MAG: hypothetical protein KAH20_08105 [Methylococcales bacterium]|nr:hypothetical protein [Methylococcales bacterium]
MSNKIQIIYFFIVVLNCSLLLFSNQAYALVTVTISDEARGNTIAGRTAAATLDDAWVMSLLNGAINPNIFIGSNKYSESTVFLDTNTLSYQVDWQLGYINIAGPGTPTSIDFVDVNTGTVTQGSSNSIQSGAPNPFPANTRISTFLSGNGGLNAIRFNFTNSTTPINEFGVFIGDTESRLNYGTAARIIVFDTDGNALNDTPIIHTGTVHNGTSYTPVVEPLTTPGFPTGAANNSDNKWGGSTTVFISVKSDQAIGHVYLHVGDDDHTSNNNGITEQLGIVGFQIPNAFPSWTLNKSTSSIPTMIGDSVVYNFSLNNTGNISINTVSLTDINCSVAPTLTGGDSNTNNILDPTETWLYSCSHTVTLAEANAGKIDNTATASGTPATGTLIDISDSNSLVINIPTVSVTNPKPIPTLSEYSLLILTALLSVFSYRQRNRFNFH